MNTSIQIPTTTLSSASHRRPFQTGVTGKSWSMKHIIFRKLCLGTKALLGKVADYRVDRMSTDPIYTMTTERVRESYGNESRKTGQKVITMCKVRGSVRSEIMLINED